MTTASPFVDRASFNTNQFPNITADSLARDIAFMIYGAAVYELVVCLNLYFAICNKAKMKTAIFRLITTAVFPVALSTMIMIFLQWDLKREDLTSQPDGAYQLNCMNIFLLTLAKFGYYSAATLRTRALLGKYPKILYCFYIMLAITITSNVVLLGLCINFFTTMYRITPGNISQNLLAIRNAHSLYEYQASFTTIFDMVLANALLVSFLYPIFTYLEMKFIPAITLMIKLGDVQKALVSSISSILFVTFVFGIRFQQLSLAVVVLWLNTQNTLFLRLSYFTSTELLSHHRTINTAGRHNAQTNVKSKDTGGTLTPHLPVDVVVTAGNV